MVNCPHFEWAIADFIVDDQILQIWLFDDEWRRTVNSVKLNQSGTKNFVTHWNRYMDGLGTTGVMSGWLHQELADGSIGELSIQLPSPTRWSWFSRQPADIQKFPWASFKKRLTAIDGITFQHIDLKTVPDYGATSGRAPVVVAEPGFVEDPGTGKLPSKRVVQEARPCELLAVAWSEEKKRFQIHPDEEIALTWQYQLAVYREGSDGRWILYGGGLMNVIHGLSREDAPSDAKPNQAARVPNDEDKEIVEIVKFLPPPATQSTLPISACHLCVIWADNLFVIHSLDFIRPGYANQSLRANLGWLKQVKCMDCICLCDNDYRIAVAGTNEAQKGEVLLLPVVLIPLNTNPNRAHVSLCMSTKYSTPDISTQLEMKFAQPGMRRIAFQDHREAVRGLCLFSRAGTHHLASFSFDGSLCLHTLNFVKIRDMSSIVEKTEHVTVVASWRIWHLDPEAALPATRADVGKDWEKEKRNVLLPVTHLAYRAQDDSIYTVAHKSRQDIVRRNVMQRALTNDKEAGRAPFSAGSESRQLMPRTRYQSFVYRWDLDRLIQPEYGIARNEIDLPFTLPAEHDMLFGFALCDAMNGVLALVCKGLQKTRLYMAYQRKKAVSKEGPKRRDNIEHMLFEEAGAEGDLHDQAGLNKRLPGIAESSMEDVEVEKWEKELEFVESGAEEKGEGGAATADERETFKRPSSLPSEGAQAGASVGQIQERVPAYPPREQSPSPRKRSGSPTTKPKGTTTKSPPDDTDKGEGPNKQSNASSRVLQKEAAKMALRDGLKNDTCMATDSEDDERTETEWGESEGKEDGEGNGVEESIEGEDDEDDEFRDGNVLGRGPPTKMRRTTDSDDDD